jgi:hypothetical protein
MTPSIPPPSEADMQRARAFCTGPSRNDARELAAQFAAVRAPLEARIAELEVENACVTCADRIARIATLESHLATLAARVAELTSERDELKALEKTWHAELLRLCSHWVGRIAETVDPLKHRVRKVETERDSAIAEVAALTSAITEAKFRFSKSLHGEPTLWCVECGRDFGFHLDTCPMSDEQLTACSMCGGAGRVGTMPLDRQTQDGPTLPPHVPCPACGR